MEKKWMRFLRKLKYDWRYGLFDVLRRKQKHVLTPYTPMDIRNVMMADVERKDCLFVINKENTVTESMVPALVEVGEKQSLCPMAAEKIGPLFDACESACDEKILYTSTYRDFAFQQSIYGVNPFAAKPGQSEHHSGLAADIKVDGYAGRRFILSKTGKWMARHAHEYGFIIRYPLWAEHRTKVDYEPWHLRYVGHPHAEVLYKTKRVLDEYPKLLGKSPFYRYENTFLSLQKEAPFSVPADAENIKLSVTAGGQFILWGTVKNEEN